MASKHKWTAQENEVCCEEYVKTYLINHSSMSANDFVKNVLSLNPMLADVPVSSLKMKVSNTRAIILDLGLEKHDSFQGSVLDNYSNAHFEQMQKVLKKYSFI